MIPAPKSEQPHAPVAHDAPTVQRSTSTKAALRGMSYDQQVARLSPVQRQSSDMGATPLAATATSENGSVSQADLAATIEAARPTLEEGLTEDFGGQVHMEIAAGGTPGKIAMDRFVPSGPEGIKMRDWVVYVLGRQTFPKPTPAGSSAVVDFDLALRAPRA